MDSRPDRTGADLDHRRIDTTTLVGTEGRFRVGRSTGGRWWLIRPDGRPMLYKGCCALWMPDDYTGQEAARYRKRWDEQHGRDAEALRRHCFGILADRGLNALGEWATPLFYDQGWPFTVLIHVRQVCEQAAITDKLVDVFDPAWQAAYDQRCREVCPPLADSRDLVGYYVDNEGGWYTARRDFVWGYDQGPMVDRNLLGQGALLLQMFLAAGEKHPGHHTAWNWVLERHGGSVAQVAKDWGTDFTTVGELRERTAKDLALASSAYRVDHEAFTELYVRTFFRITAEAIRRHDPHHLLLGPRFGGTPGDEVLRCFDRRHLDVVSWNCYNLGFAKRCEEFSQATGMPQLNGEYSWASGGFLDWNKLMARGRFTPEEMATCRRLGQAVLEEAVAHPALIGYTWYKFCCNAVDADQPHCGLIDEYGVENRFTSSLLRQINPRLEDIACGRLAPAGRE